jgi:hypothetical protein
MLPCGNRTSSTVASVMSVDVRGKVLSPLCSILVIRVELIHFYYGARKKNCLMSTTGALVLESKIMKRASMLVSWTCIFRIFGVFWCAPSNCPRVSIATYVKF